MPSKNGARGSTVPQNAAKQARACQVDAPKPVATPQGNG
jgi:hypothetical protein